MSNTMQYRRKSHRLNASVAHPQLPNHPDVAAPPEPSLPPLKPQPEAVDPQPQQPEQSQPHTPQQPEPSLEKMSENQSSTQMVSLNDDGSRRCRMRRPLRFCPEALEACGKELATSAAQGSEVKRKRKRKRNGKKAAVRCGRGLAKPREPVEPDGRPELMVVGDVEFTSSPVCTKVITTIRLLTLENMPGPYRSYNMFPTWARLDILQKFLQRYSWGHGEDVGRCLDVYENIAADAYSRELTERRKLCMQNLGTDKELWKDFPPPWCKNVDHWKGLCEIWGKDKWDQQSSTNRNNKTKGGHVLHHVGGSRSSFRHKQAMILKKKQE